MKRYLEKPIAADLREKMVFVGGPRQVGKTTLAKNLAPARHRYLNWDAAADREFVLRQNFPVEKFVVYDEIHKFKLWRNYLKGFYDTRGDGRKILVTGSARLDYYRHSGDSLQGRYHYYRLHPFSVGELKITAQADMEKLLGLGGFPEPFLSGSERRARRWMREYRQRVINEEVSSLELSHNLAMMELLLLRLPELVGSPLSVNALREDLNLAHKTVSRWLEIFERMYLIYRLAPFAANTLRAVKKERKHYHYNWAEVPGEAARFENLVAGHLLKWVHFQQDYEGRNVDLRYFRDTDGREVDFVITENKQPLAAVECKRKSGRISPHLKYFKARFPQAEAVQVHLRGDAEFISAAGVEALGWKRFLSRFG